MLPVLLMWECKVCRRGSRRRFRVHDLAHKLIAATIFEPQNLWLPLAQQCGRISTTGHVPVQKRTRRYATDRAVMIQSDNVSRSRVYPNSFQIFINQWIASLQNKQYHVPLRSKTCGTSSCPKPPTNRRFKRPVHQIRGCCKSIAPPAFASAIFGARAVNASTTPRLLDPA